MEITHYKFNMIEDESNLAKVYNHIFDALSTAHIFAAPTFFPETQRDADDQWRYAVVFYNLLLGEKYLHSVIDILNKWKNTITDYLFEYDGSWKYYACTNRLKIINDFGGDDDDYDDDGNIVTTNLSNKHLEFYTIISDIALPDERNIALDTFPDQLETFCRIIETETSRTMKDLFDKTFGKGTFKFYEKDENGNARTISEEDNDMMRTMQGVDGEDMIKTVLLTSDLIQHYRKQLLELDPFKDNKEELQIVLTAATGMLNCSFDEYLNVSK